MAKSVLAASTELTSHEVVALGVNNECLLVKLCHAKIEKRS